MGKIKSQESQYLPKMVVNLGFKLKLLEPYKPWSWSSNTLAIRCEELTHWKRPWCLERLSTGGRGDDRGWDGWMASLTQWTWVWASSGRWWRTGKPGVLHPMGLDTTERLNRNRNTWLLTPEYFRLEKVYIVDTWWFQTSDSLGKKLWHDGVRERLCNWREIHLAFDIWIWMRPCLFPRETFNSQVQLITVYLAELINLISKSKHFSLWRQGEQGYFKWVMNETPWISSRLPLFHYRAF